MGICIVGDGIQSALSALNSACLKGKAKRSTSESLEKLALVVSLLLSPPTVLPFDKLETLLRGPLVVLYDEQLDLALSFAAITAKGIIQHEILPRALMHAPDELYTYRRWEAVLCSLFSGILDFLDDKGKDRAKTVIGSLFMKTLCNYFFSESPMDVSCIAVELRCTVYLLLSDITVKHPSNQRRMRDTDVLGGNRLGQTIALSKDYTALEALLNLLARLLPPSTNRKKRLAFINSVFINSDRFHKCGEDIVNLLQDQTVMDWELTSTKINEVIAKSDISMPQPFLVDAVTVCGVKFPQTEVSDRFFVDKTSFFVNVKQGDGLYESLQVYSDNISGIEISGEGDTIDVCISLRTAPTLSDEPMKIGDNTMLVLSTKILQSDRTRFEDAIQHRSLGPPITKTIMNHASKRASVTRSSAILANVPINCTAAGTTMSPSTKARNVERFYETASTTGKTSCIDAGNLQPSVDKANNYTGECIGSATPRPSGQFANVPNAVDNVDSQPQFESNTNSKPTNNEGNQPNVHSEGVTPMGRKGNQDTAELPEATHCPSSSGVSSRKVKTTPGADAFVKIENTKKKVPTKGISRNMRKRDGKVATSGGRTTRGSIAQKAADKHHVEMGSGGPVQRADIDLVGGKRLTHPSSDDEYDIESRKKARKEKGRDRNPVQARTNGRARGARKISLLPEPKDTNNSPASSGEADKLTVISVAPKTRIQGLGTEKKRDHSPVLPTPGNRRRASPEPGASLYPANPGVYEVPRFTDSSLEGRSQLIPQVAMCQPPKRQSAGQAIIDLTSDTEDSPQARDMQAGLEDVPELDTPAYKNEKSEGKPLTISHRQHFEVLSTSGQHKVTFSEAIGIKDLPKSEPYQKPVGIVPHLQSIHSRVPEKITSMSGKYPSKPNAQYDERVLKDPGMEDLDQVLKAIQHAIVRNVATKSQGVRSDVRFARNKLLHEVIQDLSGMFGESTKHLDNLLCIESAYAKFGRELDHAYEGIHKDFQPGNSFLVQTIAAHERSSLSRTMARSVFPSTLPAVFKGVRK